MNGVRSTFMRRGYLLTALSALLLLAASAGTASAQSTGVTITGPTNNTVNEGGTATYTVAIRGYVGVATDTDNSGVIEADEANNPAAFNVALGTLGPADAATATATVGEDADLNANAHVLSVSFDPPSNSSATNRLLFTQSQRISVSTLHDNDAENEAFTIAFTALTGVDEVFTTADTSTSTPISLPANAPTSLTIDDDETQRYTLTLTPGQTTAPTEGVMFSVDLKASPAHVQGTGMLNVIIDKQSGWSHTVEGGAGTPATTTTVTSGADESTRTISITQTLGDRNRVTDTVTVSAHTGAVGASREVASLSVDVADAHVLQTVTAMVVDKDGRALATQPTSVEEGDSVQIAVMPVDKDGKVTTANETLKIALASSGSADSQDFRLSAPFEITSGLSVSNVVDLMVEADEDVGMEMLVLDATVSGEPGNGSETSMSAGVLTLGIEDATEKKIEPKGESGTYPPEVTEAFEAGQGEDGMLNPGETVEIMTGDLFTVADGYTASYGVAVEGDAVSASASGEMVTINAEKAGESVVMITGTARMASSSFEVSQDVSNVADVKFKVTVVDMPLMITLEMPDNVMDGNIVEGESYDIGVSANRMVTEAEGSVVVTFAQRAGAERAASNADYSIGDATIMAGYDSATAMLDVTEDMTDDAGHADGEALDLYGSYGDDGMTNVLELTIWDEAVPALPLIAQLLLALFLMAGGARLYRRRQS